MKTLSIFFLLGIINGYAQTVYFTNKDGEYSLKINDRANYQHKILQKGYLDLFVIKNESNTKVADYYISITKVISPENMTLELLITDEYRNQFKKSCNCTVIEEKEKKYDNFTALMMEIKSKKSNGILVGKSIHLVKAGNIYNIMYLTSEKLEPKYRNEIEQTVNSLMFYK